MGVALKHFEIGCKYDNINIEYRKFDVKNKRKKAYFISIIEKNVQIQLKKFFIKIIIKQRLTYKQISAIIYISYANFNKTLNYSRENIK